MKKRVSKGQLIYEHLLDQINTGVFKLGELLPTDTELSAQFEASRPTVAKSIQRLVNEGYLNRKAGLGTYLTEDESKGGTTKQHSFGLLIPSLGETEIFEPICGQIAQLADQYHFNLLWGGGSYLPSKAEAVIQLAQKYIHQKVDGVFFNPLELMPEAMATNLKVMNLFSKANIPVVLLDSDITSAPDNLHYDLVGINNLEAGLVMGQHLIQQGCKKIAFMTQPHVANTVHLRWMGLNEAVRQANNPAVTCHTFNCDGNFDTFVANLLKAKVDSVLACNDAMAAEIMRSIGKLNIRIPHDLKLGGFDDVKYAELLKVPLTTYHQPCKDIGMAAVEAMASRLKNPQLSPRRVLLLGELCIREST